MKETIKNSIENCTNEHLKERMTLRVARRYCAVNRVHNTINDETITKAIIPSVSVMLDNLSGRDFEVILKSRPFRDADVELDDLNIHCSECWECDGENCPFLARRFEEDEAARLQFEKMEAEIDFLIVDDSEDYYGESTVEVLDEREEDQGYMGNPGFRDAADYWNYILG